MANISFFFPKTKAGRRAGSERRSGQYGRECDAAGCAAGGFLSLSFAAFWQPRCRAAGRTQLYLANAARIWVPSFAIFTLAAWFGMNELAICYSLKEQLPVLKQTCGHLWIMSLLYLATFGSFYQRFLRGVRCCHKNREFPDVRILHYAFSVRLSSARWRIRRRNF